MIEKINAEFIHLFIFLKVLSSLSESRFKALVHKNENDVINCRSKPVRPSFIIRTQIQIFVMNSESSLTWPSIYSSTTVMLPGPETYTVKN